MTKKFKRMAAFVTAVAMVFSMQLYLPGNVYTDFGLGITVNAKDEISTEAAITPVQPATGDGSEENPYQIGTAGELCWFAGLVNNDAQNTSAKAVLTADIDLSGIDNWTPIGNSNNKYTGSFDGNNHTIKSMSITKQGYNSGLFGYTDNAAIKNIIITGEITITAASYTEGYGSIAGRMDDSTIINCHSSVNITITKDSTIDAKEKNCIGHIGGIVGKMHQANSAISNCSYSGTIELNDRPVKVAAGIVGYATNNSVPITNCSFTGKINSNYSGANYIGGIFGYTRSSGDVKVTNCLSAGTISKSGDTSLTGIIIGQINGGYGKNAVKNNYYSSSSSLDVFGTISDTPTTTPAILCDEKKLASGEVAYLLQDNQKEDVWGQTIGTDKCPVLGGAKVYLTTPCIGYSNSANKEHPAHDEYVNGFATCTVCGAKMYEPATVVSAEHHPELNGTHSGYYAIENAGQLCWFAGLVNNDANVCTDEVTQNISASAVLTADIDLSSIDNWTPIGNTVSNQYGGTFDGNNHTINDMSITERRDFSGLFGRTYNATIKNIIITGKITITTESRDMRYGSIVGFAVDTIVTNCHSSVKITVNSTMDNTNEGTGFIGGIVGRQWIDDNNNSTISNCSYSGTIELNVDNDIRTRYVGGIAGSNFIRVLITNCSFTGKISSNSSGANYIGGILGYTTVSKVNITNCLSVGTISKSEDTSQAGLIIGRITNASGANAMKNNYYLSSSSLGMFGSIDGTLTTTPATLCNEDQMASGEVAYLLQGNQKEVVWGQTIGTDKYPVLGGAKVYLTTPCFAYSNSETKNHIDSNNDGACDDCKESVESIGARLAGYSLSLNGNIDVNFHMEIGDTLAADNNSYMLFTLPNNTTQKVPVTDASISTIEGHKYYIFTCEVAAKEMTADIKAQMFDGKGNVGTIYTYSVKKYADYILEHTSDYTEETVDLVKAMLNYGAYSQIYFEYKNEPENLANTGVDVYPSTITAETLNEYAASYVKDNSYKGSTEYYGSSLVLNSGTDINHYFTYDTSIGIEHFTCKDSNNNSYEVAVSKGMLYVSVKNISAHNLGDNLQLTLYEDSMPVGTISYSPMSYAYAVLKMYSEESSENKSLRNVVIALYDYYTKAKAYKS